MEIENIVANTVLIKAKEGGCSKSKGRSKKWKTYLKFPHISECLTLREELTCTYDYIIDQQPIGREQFRLFCKYSTHNDIYMQAIGFLEAVEEYETADMEERGRIAEMTASKYLDRLEAIVLGTHTIAIEEASTSKLSKTPQQVFANCRAALAKAEASETNKFGKDIFGDVVKETRLYLSADAFVEFLTTPYFNRYLQWKAIERRETNKHVFRMYRVLGKGGFGEVCACQVRASGKMYALKKLEKKRVKKRHAEQLSLNEKQILERINSSFVVSLAYAFETKDSLNLVLTLMNGGDLKYHLYNMETGNGGFPEDRVRFYAAQITLGLQHLHEKHIVYRDLKPENILLDDTGNIRISDLGLAVELVDNHAVRGRVGTVGYMPPEVIRNEKYAYAVDWWGLGCLIFEMTEAKAPFRARREKVKRDEVERRVLHEIEKYSPKFTDTCRTLCRGLLQKEATLRMGSRRVRKPEWGAGEVKEHAFFSTLNWRRMEVGKVSIVKRAWNTRWAQIPPPFEPDARTVYAKDVLDIEQFSTVKGVRIGDEDVEMYGKFNTGRVSIPWQHEMIETECYQDLNECSMIVDGEPLPMDLDPEQAPIPKSERKPNWFMRLFAKRRPPTSSGRAASAPDVATGKANGEKTLITTPKTKLNGSNQTIDAKS